MRYASLLVGVCIIMFHSANGAGTMTKMKEGLKQLFQKVTKTDVKGILICAEGESATSGTIELYDKDQSKDDLIASVDLGKTEGGAFKLSGNGTDFKFIDPTPDLYLKISKACGVECGRIKLKDYKTTEDNTIDLDLGSVDMSEDPDSLGMKKC